MSAGIGVDWALAINGATVTASSQMVGGSWTGPASAAIDGDRIGALWSNPSNNYAGGGGWNDNTPGVWPDWLEVDFAGTHTIDEMDVFTNQTPANYQSDHVPTPSDTSPYEGLIDYQMQYCPSGVTCTNSATAPYGTGWQDVTLGGADVGHITNNSNTWRHVAFTPVQTSKIRILTNNGRASSSRIVEVEAWETTAVGKDWALAANGATATVSSSYSSDFSASNAIDGDRSAWGYPGAEQAMWCSAQSPSAGSPDIFAVTFAGSASISEIDLFGQQDNKTATVVPTPTLASTLFSYQQYRIQYCPAGTTCSSAMSYPGTGWVDVPGSPASSTLVWNRFSFPVVQTQQIRAVFTSIADHDYSRIAELEAWDFSSAPGTNSSSSTTAMALRRQMAGATGCGAIQPATIGVVTGDEETCASSWIDWSAATGAWFLPVSHDSNAYLGGQIWPSAASVQMVNLGFQAGPYVGNDRSNNYTIFANGILATALGSSTPYLIGGVSQCPAKECMAQVPGTQCSCNASTVNTGLATLWYNDTQINKYPSSTTREYSLGTCSASTSGERAFLFDSIANGSGYSTTYIVADGSPFAHEISGADHSTWESAGCATQTALGLPLSNEMPYTLATGAAATHQEFEGGTIKFEPSGCSGPNVSTILTYTGGPAHASSLGNEFCSVAANTNPCTNSPPIPYAGSDGASGTYYYHCMGAAGAGPGASAGSGWYDGITINTAGGAEYSLDDPMFQYWISQGEDHQTVAGAIAANAPPNFHNSWAFDGTDVMANYNAPTGGPSCFVNYVWSDNCDQRGQPACLNAGDATFQLQFTTPILTSPPIDVMTEPGAQIGYGWNSAKVPAVCGGYNCVNVTYVHSYDGGTTSTVTEPTECVWVPSDNVPRTPHRLQLEVEIAASSGTPQGGVFAKLTEPSGYMYSKDNLTFLDSSDPLWIPGRDYTFDLLTDDIDDINDISEIRIGNTDTSRPLCINSLTLRVDDDGEMNKGDACTPDATPGCAGGRAGVGSADPVLFTKNFVADTGSCASTVGVDVHNPSTTGTSILVPGLELRAHPKWTYQLQHWTSKLSSDSDIDTHSDYEHFSGFGDAQSIVGFITATLATSLHLAGSYRITTGMPTAITAETETPTSLAYDRLHVTSYFSGNHDDYTLNFDLVITNYCTSGVRGGTQIVPQNVNVNMSLADELADCILGGPLGCGVAAAVDYEATSEFASRFSDITLGLAIPSLVSLSWYPYTPYHDDSPTSPALGVSANTFCNGTCTTATCPPPPCSPGAPGCGWNEGDEQSYPPGLWGGSNSASSLLTDGFDTVYAADGDALQVGTGFSMTFTGASPLISFLPAEGAPAALTSNLVDPTTSPSGEFGSQLAALSLNIDFSDAGLLTGASGVAFGDLLLCKLTTATGLNGSKVRDFRAAAEVLLGGGANGYSIGDLNGLAEDVNGAFWGGAPSEFAQQHLFVGSCPP
jgi:hypothetical protein